MDNVRIELARLQLASGPILLRRCLFLGSSCKWTMFAENWRILTLKAHSAPPLPLPWQQLQMDNVRVELTHPQLAG